MQVPPKEQRNAVQATAMAGKGLVKRGDRPARRERPGRLWRREPIRGLVA
jgi:hypothetical protein